MSDELRVAIEAAKIGAGRALKYFGKKPHINIKSDNSPVTIADKETEKAIKNHILKSFPKANFVGEESGGDLYKDEYWIIDPIDGTKNFIRELPLWGILIAHCKNGAITLGVSNIPLLNELIYAEKGKGAFLNDKKIKVSSVSSLKNAFLSYGNLRNLNAKSLTELDSMCLSGRGIGDAYSYHLVASGRIEIMVENKIQLWDVASFKVIVEEAGGKLSTYGGKEWTVLDRSSVATNGILHEEVIKILNNK